MKFVSFVVINGGMKFVSEERKYAPGSFCWADLVAKEVGVAKDFYTSLFGWTFEDRPVMDEAVYTIFSKDGKQTCAMFGMFPEMLDSGHPSFWQSYVTVESVDETMKKAVELGAQTAQEPCDVLEEGRVAMIRDPGEAFLCLWQPKAHKGADIMGEPGALNWNELLTKDLERAGSFYADLFGWTSVVTPDPAGGDYTVFMSGEEPRAGMIELQPEMGEMPPHWGVYFQVENFDAALEKAKSLGGQGTFPPVDVPDVGRIGGIMDPQGACFTAMESAMASAGSGD